MSRDQIHYWKTDRPSAFRTLQAYHSETAADELAQLLTVELQTHFHAAVHNIRPAGGQGNHATFLADWNGNKLFIRLEDGPEKDNYMLAEEAVIERISELDIPTVRLYKTDASRRNVRFAYQVMDFLSCKDLNSLYKSKQIDLHKTAFEIGAYIARWQAILPEGFGPFDTDAIMINGNLCGFHDDYLSYYRLNLDLHLGFLVKRQFLSTEQADSISRVIEEHQSYLQLDQGCLVHKDLALWNILGTDKTIEAFIDWDDTISGDPTDDLSLLACFYDEEVVAAAIRGYTTVKPLPRYFETRFQLHLLRNMIVKAVIRVGGNYFEKTDDFFLIDAGEKGSSLEKFTKDRILGALEKLRNKQPQLVL